MSQILIIPNTILRNKSNPIKEVSDNEIMELIKVLTAKRGK